MTGRHCLLPVLLCAVAGVQGAQAWAQDLAEEDVVLLLPSLDRRPLGDGFTAFPDPARKDRVFLPFGEVCRLLGLGMTVDAPAGRATGFYISEKRRFEFSLQEGMARFEDRNLAIPPGSIRRHGLELYVRSDLLEAWFSLKVEVDLKGSALAFVPKPQDKLPVQQAWEREGRYARLSGGAGNADQPVGPKVEEPYRWIEIPSLDGSLFWSRQTGPTSGQSVQGSALLGGDLLKMSSQLYVMRDNQGSYRYSNYTLFREDPDGTLLGSLNARRIHLGDILQLPSLELVGGLPQGRGFLVDNYPVVYRTAFGKRVFSGLIPEGWTVELYQNGALLGFQQARPDGTYAFPETSMRFGLNEFRLVFLGPQGQRREESLRLDISQDQPPSGTFFYRATAMVPSEDRNLQKAPVSEVNRRAGLAEFEYGLSNALSLHLGAARFQLPYGINDYGVAGFRSVLPFAALQVHGAYDRSPNHAPGRALGASVLTGIGYHTLNLSRSEYHGVFFRTIGENGSGDLTALQSETTLMLNSPFRVGSHTFGITLSHEERVHISGMKIAWDRFQVNTTVGGVNLTPRLSRMTDSRSPEPLVEAGLLFSAWLGNLTLQGDWSGQRSQGRFESRSWSLSGDYQPVLGWIYRAGLRNSGGRLQDTALQVSVNKLVGHYAFGVEAQHSRTSGTSLGLRVQVSLQREPRSGRWITDAQTLASQGGVSATAFVDDNGNGHQDPGERSLSEPKFRVDGSSGQAERSVDPKVAYFPQIARSRYVEVQVDPVCLDDPALQPSQPALRVLSRAGHVSQVDFPLELQGEITGTTRLRAGRGTEELPGLEVELARPDGTSVQTARSAYDGFFEFRGIRQGDYLLRVAPREAQRLGLASDARRKVTIRKGAMIQDGLDLVIEQPDLAAPPPPKVPEATPPPAPPSPPDSPLLDRSTP